MAFFSRLGVQWAHLKSLFEIRDHFENPWIIVFLRLGLIRMPYFVHRIHKGAQRYAMLARPSTTSMADLFVLREVLVEETYRDVLPVLNRTNLRLVDVGANLGSFTLWMHRRVGVREAFCFEPEADSYRLLQFNLSLNECAAAQPLYCAVGGESRTAKISLKKSSPGGTTIYAAAADPEATTIRVISFDSWLESVKGDFDLLKMDCEGAEWEIIRQTSPAAFARFQAMVVEVHGDPENKHTVPEFAGLVEKLGFRTVRWDNKPQGLYIGTRKP